MGLWQPPGVYATRSSMLHCKSSVATKAPYAGMMRIPYMFAQQGRSFLIDRISDTRSQGCTDVQSLVKCLDHGDIASDTIRSQPTYC